MSSVEVDAWRARGHMRSLLGHELFVVDSAEAHKPALLLLHGFPTSSWDWAPMWTELAARYRLIAPDFLGLGFSAKPKGRSYSILEQANLCEALVRALGLDAAADTLPGGGLHVLAHDYGDTVAQELLARQLEGVGVGCWRSLCLLNGGLFPETHHPRIIQKLLLSPLGALVGRLSSRSVFGRSFSAVFGPQTQPSSAELDDFWRIICHEQGSRVTHRLIHYMPERVEHRARWVGALRDTSLPLALINGSVDPISGAHMVARYRELLGNEDFIVELPGIGDRKSVV